MRDIDNVLIITDNVLHKIPRQMELKKGNTGIARECEIDSHFVLKYRR